MTSSSAARANGRYPESNQILFSAEDPELVVLRATFGLLVSHDRGRTFRWVCEQSIGYSGVEDPMYAITPSSTLIGATSQGVAVSRDGACGWSLAGGDLAGQAFIDLSANPKDRRNVVVFASSFDRQDDEGDLLFSSKLWETKDEARTFELLGPELDPALLGSTVDLAPTDPDRLYVTAVRHPGASPEAVLLTSTDHGKSWEEMPVPLAAGERAVFIAAVDPNDAERVYLRTLSSNPDGSTRLLLRERAATTDGGGAALRTVHDATGALLGFALSPDGRRVYVGGPKDGVKVASTDDFAFSQRSKIPVQCLGLGPDGLWACSNEQTGFIAGVSSDDGVTFEPRLHFCDVAGALSCAPGAPTSERCAPSWPAQQALLGCDGGAGEVDGGGLVDAGGLTPDPPPRRSGCDCRSSPAAPWGALVAVVGTALALARRWRRRC